MDTMEKLKFDCPECGRELTVTSGEFIDVSEDPQMKEKIVSGEYFSVTCPDCGEEMLVERPVMYIDPEHEFNVYMEPNHSADLVKSLNSIKLQKGTYRVVSTGLELAEKIFIQEAGRDDRLIEIYKYLLAQDAQDQMDLLSEDIVYTYDGAQELFVVWSSDNGEGEKMSAELNPDYYHDLEKAYGELLPDIGSQYAEVNRAWLKENLGID
ncbi:MAG: CpXC domain-containing protein [Anaerovoracaceae bacterium]|jgi:predicted RNA-binding Zn-ribbon protein involved in translation (DUF1610 family)